MSQELLLDELLDAPTFAIQAGGRRLLFSELPLAALGRLQAWLRDNTPHPVSSLAGRLDGLPDDARRRLLDRAADDARDWPPMLGTREAAAKLLGNERGLLETIYEGLRVHQPESTRADAAALIRAIERTSRRQIKAAIGARDAEAEAAEARAAAAGLDPPPRRPIDPPPAALAFVKLTAVLFGKDPEEAAASPKAGPAGTAAGATGP